MPVVNDDEDVRELRAALLPDGTLAIRGLSHTQHF